ncbi:MAG: sigma-70 family RNA polymerase sigma factor [Gemmatimonadetes bacterium]|nr:sigma-70 family RNA polymerase sigma factor [Gemmatimonadota bacterium]
MGDTPPDAVVVARVLDGDVEAFALLVDRYQDEFTAYAKHMTGSADDAADIVQESLVRAYRSLRRCGDPTRFKGWLFRIVSNQCKTHVTRRARRRRDHLDDVADDIASPYEADSAARRAELRSELEAGLQQLPADQREALVLRYIHDFSLREMTEVAGASIPALKMRLKRGREALREKLEGAV